jgi:hypothetical protein
LPKTGAGLYRQLMLRRHSTRGNPKARLQSAVHYLLSIKQVGSTT